MMSVGEEGEKGPQTLLWGQSRQQVGVRDARCVSSAPGPRWDEQSIEGTVQAGVQQPWGAPLGGRRV